MIESITFENFKVLRKTTLPLQPLTLIVGPNGSGKSTAIQGLLLMALRQAAQFDELWPVGGSAIADARVSITGQFDVADASATLEWSLGRDGQRINVGRTAGSTISPQRWGVFADALHKRLAQVRVYMFQSKLIARAMPLQPNTELAEDGGNLAVVLDRIRDEAPERFDALNAELGRWLPEFDRVLFDTPAPGQRSLKLRTRREQRAIQARNLSDGTLVALAILSLAYMSNPPPLVCFEEPDHGLHPRLMRDVRDAMYRLAYPEQCGESREPVQVIATTHSPILLDLFRDHPEEVVIANKTGTEAAFQKLPDLPNFEEILADSSLGDAWYSGVLGGVPTEP